MLAGTCGNIMHTFTEPNYGACKNCGDFKKCKKVQKIAHVRRVTSQVGVGAESFSLEGILSFMVPNWGPPPSIPIPP